MSTLYTYLFRPAVRELGSTDLNRYRVVLGAIDFFPATQLVLCLVTVCSFFTVSTLYEQIDAAQNMSSALQGSDNKLTDRVDNSFALKVLRFICEMKITSFLDED